MDAHHDDRSPHRRLRWLAIRVAGAVVIAVALALLPYRAIDSKALVMLERITHDVDSARQRLAELETENTQLRRDISALRSDGRAIEEFARRDLGMTRPGEVLIRAEVPE